MATIRIDIITSDEPEDIVRLSGRLTEGEAFQLKKACNSIGKRFVLDLSDLLFADDAGINLLQELKKNGAEHRGASPFIQMLLDRSPVKKND
jgi:anti-anti-sigma regulatory factor